MVFLTKQSNLYVSVPDLFNGKYVLKLSKLWGFFSSKSVMSTSETPIISNLVSFIVLISFSSFLNSSLQILRLATLKLSMKLLSQCLHLTLFFSNFLLSWVLTLKDAGGGGGGGLTAHVHDFPKNSQHLFWKSWTKEQNQYLQNSTNWIDAGILSLLVYV